jgi:hypothetical protein
VGIVVLEEDYSSEWASSTPKLAIPKKKRKQNNKRNHLFQEAQLIVEA